MDGEILTQKIEQFYKRIDDANDAIGQARQNLQRISEQEMAKFRSALKKPEDQLDSLQKSVSDWERQQELSLNRALDKLKGDLSKEQQQIKTDFEKWKETTGLKDSIDKVLGLAGRVTSAEERLEDDKSKIEQDEQKITDIETRLKALTWATKRIDEINGLITDISKQLNELNQSVTNLEKEKVSSQGSEKIAEMVEQTPEVLRHAQSLTDLENRLGLLSARLEQFEQEKAQCMDKIEASKQSGNGSDLRQEVEKLSQRFSVIEQKVSQDEHSVATAQREAHDTTIMDEEQCLTCSTKSERIDQLRLEIGQIDQQLRQLKEQRQGKIADLKKAVAEKKAEDDRKMLEAIAASGKSVDEVLAWLQNGHS